MTPLAPAAVFFDLDGTLVDTAPDMAGALNSLRERRGLPALPRDELRPLVSHGSRALIERGLAPADEAQCRALITEFLDAYAARIAQESSLFDGMAALLDDLAATEVPWGVVTNKPEHLSVALLDALALSARSRVLIGGDTLTLRKPHPLPLLHAAAQLGVPANACVYVGDAERDVRAGRAAGMTTVAAAYGYVLPDDTPETWRADFLVRDVAGLRALLTPATPRGERRAHH